MNKYGSYTKEIKYDGKYVLDFGDLFYLVVNFTAKYPKLVEHVLKITKDKDCRSIKCPFPSDCNEFPCQSLRCNGDCCSNGYVTRMS